MHPHFSFQHILSPHTLSLVLIFLLQLTSDLRGPSQPAPSHGGLLVSGGLSVTRETWVSLDIQLYAPRLSLDMGSAPLPTGLALSLLPLVFYHRQL